MPRLKIALKDNLKQISCRIPSGQALILKEFYNIDINPPNLNEKWYQFTGRFLTTDVIYVENYLAGTNVPFVDWIRVLFTNLVNAILKNKIIKPHPDKVISNFSDFSRRIVNNAVHRLKGSDNAQIQDVNYVLAGSLNIVDITELDLTIQGDSNDSDNK